MATKERPSEHGEVTMDLTPEQALGTYSNLVVISHSSSEFVFDFARLMPGLTSPKVVSRIVMTPDHAKRFLRALRDNVAIFERQVGEIDLPEQEQAVRLPFTEGTTPEA